MLPLWFYDKVPFAGPLEEIQQIFDTIEDETSNYCISHVHIANAIYESDVPYSAIRDFANVIDPCILKS